MLGRYTKSSREPESASQSVATDGAYSLACPGLPLPRLDFAHPCRSARQDGGFTRESGVPLGYQGTGREAALTRETPATSGALVEDERPKRVQSRCVATVNDDATEPAEV